MQFPTWERAQKAADLLDSSKFDNSKIAISEIFFEDRGRRLILKFDSSGALPSEIISFVFDVIDAASAERPLTQEINIPLVQN